MVRVRAVMSTVPNRLRSRSAITGVILPSDRLPTWMLGLSYHAYHAELLDRSRRAGWQGGQAGTAVSESTFRKLCRFSR